jgi:hypothetical protein
LLTGVYCCGWVRTGPTGVILSTLNEGRETAKVVVKDLNEGAILRNISTPTMMTFPDIQSAQL